MSKFNCTDNTTYIPGQKKITPTGTIEITENGTFDVTQYANADVNVSGGGDYGSKVAVGTFTTQSTTGVQEVEIPYDGTGYPLSVSIRLQDESAIENGHVIAIMAVNRYENPPSYNSGYYDSTYCAALYFDHSDGKRKFRAPANQKIYEKNITGDVDAITSPLSTVAIPSKNRIKVAVTENNETSYYGFAPNKTYVYMVTYSE